jgi:hypothetical protein
MLEKETCPVDAMHAGSAMDGSRNEAIFRKVFQKTIIT